MNLKQKRKIKVKTKKLANSFKYAMEGFVSSFHTERNMKIHIFIMLCVVILGFYFHISLTEWMLCILAIVIVIGGELFNTAIETIVDMVMPYRNEKAKLAKDVAAAAVLVLSVGAALIGIMIFLPKIMEI